MVGRNALWHGVRALEMKGIYNNMPMVSSPSSGVRALEMTGICNTGRESTRKTLNEMTTMKHECVIHGSVPSKSNCYRIVTIAGHASLTKTKAMREFEQRFYLQCGYRNQDIKGFFELHADIFFQSNQPDLDNALKGLLDCLQSCRAIRNDRYCVKIVACKFVDKENPRIEFTIIPCDAGQSNK